MATLVVLAAGMGSRYGGLKQVDQFGPNGETLVEYTIYDAIQAGFTQVVFVIREHMAEQFKALFDAKLNGKIKVDYVFQELHKLPLGYQVPDGREKPWGTAHAVMMTREVINQPFATVNTDDFYGFKSMKIIRRYLNQLHSDDLGGCVVGYQLKNTLSDHGSVSRGVCETYKQNYSLYLKSIQERTNIQTTGGLRIFYLHENIGHHLDGKTLVSMNLLGFTPAVFALMEKEFKIFLETKAPQNLKAEYFLPLVIDRMVQMDIKIPVLPTDDKWFGVTYKEDKPIVQQELRKLIAAGAYPNDLWN